MIFNDTTHLIEALEKGDKEAIESLIDKKEQTLCTTNKRSALMVSGHQIKHLNKLDTLQTDIVMLNLEDGVPKEKKEIARSLIALFLSKLQTYDKEYVVRVNPLGEGGEEDIAYLEKYRFNAFRIPKVETLEEVKKVHSLTSKPIHLSVETKELFFNLDRLKREKIEVLYLGVLDLFDDMKLSHSLISHDNLLMDQILIDFSLKTRYIGATPVGFTYQYYKDEEGFRQWCEKQKKYGFSGVGCITPRQAEIANEVFKEENLEFAKMIVDRFEREGNFTINGLFVDEPIYKNYRNRLEKK